MPNKHLVRVRKTLSALLKIFVLVTANMAISVSRSFSRYMGFIATNMAGDSLHFPSNISNF